MLDVAQKANVVIRTEESLDDDVDMAEDELEAFIQKLWAERFDSVGFDRDYEVELESVEQA